MTQTDGETGGKNAAEKETKIIIKISLIDRKQPKNGGEMIFIPAEGILKLSAGRK